MRADQLKHGPVTTQNRPSTTSEPAYGDDPGQRQPAQDGERPDQAGKRPGHEAPRIVEAVSTRPGGAHPPVIGSHRPRCARSDARAALMDRAANGLLRDRQRIIVGVAMRRATDQEDGSHDER